MLVASLAVIGALYAAFLVLDVWLMRRYARLDEEPAAKPEEVPQPLLGF
jgi:cytochrome bd-type quinol oxidase subunit 1